MSSSGVNLENYFIPLEEIKRATENFSQQRCIGDGGFGAVYKGQLSEQWQNCTVAVKRLGWDSYQGDHEFHNELEMISRCHHKNIISFIGYCDENKEMIIVYDYAVNGSLDHHLYDRNKMRNISWKQRLKICIGAARGLNYLHSGLEEHNRIIHRDVKSANILLDWNLEAKVCDFGLSKLGPKNRLNTELFTKVAGTQFYLDPVYHESRILRKESDVYSFGVVLFEILSGRLVYSERTTEDNGSELLMTSVRRHSQNVKAQVKLIDPRIRLQTCDRSFSVFIQIAYQCISFNVLDRPRMETVVDRLQEALDIQSRYIDEGMIDRKGTAPAIGIDLGSIYSCVAVCQQDKVHIISTMPSSVTFTDGGRLFGDAAMYHMDLDPTNTIYDAKRLIGRKFSDAKFQEDIKLLPFRVIKGTNDIPKIVVEENGEKKEFSAEEISSMVLTQLKGDAEVYLGETVHDVVITVPGYFNDYQRQATKDAGHIAGLNVLQIIDEPISAAIAYLLDMRIDETRDTNMLIFDLGDTTLNVSLVTVDYNGSFIMKAVRYTHIGGEDIDNNMVDHFVSEFDKKHKTNMRENRKALGRLRAACDRAKRDLHWITEATVEIHDLHQGLDFPMRITREMFENLNADLFIMCMEIVEGCLDDARMNKNDVDEVVLVGKSTTIPKVRELLKDFFNGKELCKTIYPGNVVVYGAAVHAAKLSGGRSHNGNN